MTVIYKFINYTELDSLNSSVLNNNSVLLLDKYLNKHIVNVINGTINYKLYNSFNINIYDVNINHTSAFDFTFYISGVIDKNYIYIIFNALHDYANSLFIIKYNYVDNALVYFYRFKYNYDGAVLSNIIILNDVLYCVSLNRSGKYHLINIDATSGLLISTNELPFFKTGILDPGICIKEFNDHIYIFTSVNNVVNGQVVMTANNRFTILICKYSITNISTAVWLIQNNDINAMGDNDNMVLKYNNSLVVDETGVYVLYKGFSNGLNGKYSTTGHHIVKVSHNGEYIYNQIITSFSPVLLDHVGQSEYMPDTDFSDLIVMSSNNDDGQSIIDGSFNYIYTTIKRSTGEITNVDYVNMVKTKVPTKKAVTIKNHYIYIHASDGLICHGVIPVKKSNQPIRFLNLISILNKTVNGKFQVDYYINNYELCDIAQVDKVMYLISSYTFSSKVAQTSVINLINIFRDSDIVNNLKQGDVYSGTGTDTTDPTKINNSVSITGIISTNFGPSIIDLLSNFQKLLYVCSTQFNISNTRKLKKNIYAYIESVNFAIHLYLNNNSQYSSVTNIGIEYINQFSFDGLPISKKKTACSIFVSGFQRENALQTIGNDSARMNLINKATIMNLDKDEIIDVSLNLSGWNLIGSCAKQYTIKNNSIVIPNTLYTLLNGETYLDTTNIIYPTKGHWIKTNNTGKIELINKTTVANLEIQESAIIPIDLSGWNLIGSCDKYYTIVDNSGIIIPNTLYSFNGETYAQSTPNMLEPAKGYWIKINNTGKIKLTNTLIDRINSSDFRPFIFLDW